MIKVIDHKTCIILCYNSIVLFQALVK